MKTICIYLLSLVVLTVGDSQLVATPYVKNWDLVFIQQPNKAFLGQDIVWLKSTMSFQEFAEHRKK